MIFINILVSVPAHSAGRFNQFKKQPDIFKAAAAYMA